MSAAVTTPEAAKRVERLGRLWTERPGIVGWLTTCDHKRIGILYLFTSLAFFAAGGGGAPLVRPPPLPPGKGPAGPRKFYPKMTPPRVPAIFPFRDPPPHGAVWDY